MFLPLYIRMPWISYARRHPVGMLTLILSLGALVPEARPTQIAIVGAQGSVHRTPAALSGTRLSVFETDAWRHSLDTGALDPVPQVPLPKTWDRRKDLLRGTNFTPDAYLEQIATFRGAFSRQRDILMYYGGIRRHPSSEGLNFNAWSGPDLRKLRALGCRPFIGLESMDRSVVRFLIWRLKEAGYGRQDRIYVRIGAEPAYSRYVKTPEAYKQAFARTAEYINAMNRRHGLNIHIVFAGAAAIDFSKYLPDDSAFDAFGYDLYVTPENKDAALKQLGILAKKYPYKPLVIPEFGIATQGPAHTLFARKSVQATPAWAADALGDILESLSRHPSGVEEITVFSVNVPARLRNRRWNWALTPRMYEMLKEWETSPRRWRKNGFHAYDPMSYPVGRDVLYLNRADVRIVYRKLAEVKAPGVPLFVEAVSLLEEGKWVHQCRKIYFQGSATYPG